MLCRVLKSKKKADTYLYLPLTTPLSDLPAPLQTLFSPEQEALRLNVTAERQFARLSGVKLLAALENEGYYLQVPPPPENLLDGLRSDKT
ncbi:YcgL domain-containing protein [Aliidiomarina sanyensis]|uniref:YcgL domain-containing protein CWE11_04785 n=1 Tax=Aliidiomarina sanyensis TaxID=1249555 RepID=A0A432WNG5_9GAMM|nr:YcgL domain-containing protein [Aliidiomarina sanyensis]RUO35333.1 hypothetical protein CWE11_04785 [Aliidiomarina sanyensis]